MGSKKAESLIRAIDVAGTMFRQHRFEDVAVNEIARVAHCSTATLYRVYGNKEKLYLAAMQEMMKNSAPKFSAANSVHGISGLLHFEYARLEFLSRRETRTVFRAVLRQPELLNAALFSLVKSTHRDTERMLMTLIRQAITEGTLRAVPPKIICDNLISIGTYESVMRPLFYGPDMWLDASAILRQQLLPFLTAEGERALEWFLEPRNSHATSRAA